MSFLSLGISADVCARLAQRQILQPFPIQAATLPDALAGRDVCGRAPTGSGKTLAFGLAISGTDGSPRPRRPYALVLVPTRELAAQVRRELAALFGPRADEVVCVHGGTRYELHRRSLARGVSVLVACPGRLEDLVAQGDVVLDSVRLAVVDEADRMADLGFLPAVRRLLDRTPATRQTLLFSATLDDEVQVLVDRYQRDPVRHDVGDGVDEHADVRHEFRATDRTARVAVTAELIREHGRTIVFCRTRHGADRLTRQLGRAGVPTAALHGNRTQPQRERAVARFAAGEIGALVATDLAARGIHVDDVQCVVHFDLPAETKTYVHRSGRTGRAGAPGLVVSLVTDADEQIAGTLRRAIAR